MAAGNYRGHIRISFLLDAFSLLTSENESIFVCFRQQFFYNFSLTILVTHGKISCRKQNIIDEKKLLTALCLSVNSLTQSHNHQKKFLSKWSYGQLGEWGQGHLAVEKQKASIFQAADFATNVADMPIELYCYQDQLLFQNF